MNHFQRLTEVKVLKIFFFAQHVNVSADQNRPCAWRLDHATGVSAVCAQQTSKYVTSLLNVVSPSWVLKSNEALRCSACPPPPPPPSQILGSLLNFVSHILLLCSSPIRVTHSFITLPHAFHSNTLSRSICYSPNTLCDVTRSLRGGSSLSRLCHTVFPPKGLLLSGQGGCSRRPQQG